VGTVAFRAPPRCGRGDAGSQKALRGCGFRASLVIVDDGFGIASSSRLELAPQAPGARPDVASPRDAGVKSQSAARRIAPWAETKQDWIDTGPGVPPALVGESWDRGRSPRQRPGRRMTYSLPAGRWTTHGRNTVGEWEPAGSGRTRSPACVLRFRSPAENPPAASVRIPRLCDVKRLRSLPFAPGEIGKLHRHAAARY
jgi:hypothetical protein